MATQKQKTIHITTPVGTAGYPNFVVPDTKFVAGGVYKTDWIGDMADPKVVAILAQIDKASDEGFEAAKEQLATELAEAKTAKDKAKVQALIDNVTRHAPYEEVTDDANEPTGEVKLAMKMNATITKKDGTVIKQKPALFDAKGKPANCNPWSGSRIATRFEMVPYYMKSTGLAGVTLRLKSAQVVELVSGSGGSAASQGFEVHDDGFEDDGSAGTPGSDVSSKPVDAPADDGSGNF